VKYEDQMLAAIVYQHENNIYLKFTHYGYDPLPLQSIVEDLLWIGFLRNIYFVVSTVLHPTK